MEPATTSDHLTGTVRFPVSILLLACQLPEGLLHSAPDSLLKQLLRGDRLVVLGCTPLMERIRSTAHWDKPCDTPLFLSGQWVRECLHLPYGKADLLPTRELWLDPRQLTNTWLK